MKCPRCGHENRRPDRRFCGECGVLLSLVCVACGFSNDPGEKFCGGCGQPLTPRHLAEKILTSKAALEGERRQVTVLFADLKGSMELLADRDPQDARRILDLVPR